ncbi:MAG: glycosyltransferase family 2 protein, partial [Balneolaceae bacterium]|nr:glycosyltransferase family 2 protein [Balneolaceae bacterium]
MSSKNPLVSAVIPTRNRSSLLQRALESVVVQSYKPIEVIVV